MASNPDKFETAFDTYTVIQVIGEGGAGRVFEVKNAKGEIFAVKCLRPSLVNEDRRKRFKNEMDFCRKQDHRNLVRVVDSGIVEWEGTKTPFYVMPRYSATLRDVMAAKIPVTEVLKMFGQILNGVEAAHLSGVTHRDLKPENILVDKKSGQFVVSDFGIAHFEEQVIATIVETKKAEKLANIRYSAPEQRMKGAAVDKRADIYALGLILNEMFTGQVPEGAGHKTIASTAAEYAYLDALVDKMRQQDPAARPVSIEEVKKELIGRQNAFIELQKLDEQKRAVVPAAAPDTVQDVVPVGMRWEEGVLTIELNRQPEAGWIQRLYRPFDGSYMMNQPPTAYRFAGNAVRVEVEGHQAQRAYDQFKGWAPKITALFQQDLTQAAAKRDYEQRRALEAKVKAAEEAARVNQNLKP